MSLDGGFTYLRRVAFADTDMAGIAHFSRMFCYMEEAEHAMWRSVGLSVHQQWEDATIGWPRLSAKCDYRSPARFEECLAILVRVVEIKSRTVRYSFRATVEEREVATGEFLVICCEVSADHSIRSIEIPSLLVEKLQGFQ